MLVSGLPGPDSDDNGRPMKRPRNWASSSFEEYQDHPQYNFPAQNSYPGFDITKPEPPAPHREREKNPNRTLSCRECRRLKLKCDRNFPCQSCRKRGCGDICPEGALTSGRGSRFILANTGQLHAKISQLSDRVRQLEDDAARQLQSRTSLTFPGTLANEDDSGILRSTSERIHLTSRFLSSRRRKSTSSCKYVIAQITGRTTGPPDVAPDVLQLSVTFPFPWAVDLKIRERIRNSLPSREEAEEVCKEARANALWQYNLDASETFLPNLLHHCYESPIKDLSPRRLALLLMVLSIGNLVDLNKPLGNLYGEAYHHLARASVCEIPLMEEPDFDTLHALFFMIWYHLIFSDNKKAVGYAWNLCGFVAKLAQGLGLHREGSRIKKIPEEHEKRRLVFWELLNLDCRMSLSLGRPPSIALTHVDIKPPEFNAQGLYVSREEMIYHEWKNLFFIECLTPILEAIVCINTPPYEKIIELDSRVRNFAIPDLLKEDHGGSGANTRFLNMQRALVSTGRDIALLQNHRRPFMELMSSPEQFDWNNKFAPSILATYLGCSSIIAAVETLFDKEEQLSGRFLCFWFNAFSAFVTLSLLVSREPSCALAPCALTDLDRPVIEKMLDKTRRVYLNWRHQAQVEGDNNISGFGGISSSSQLILGTSPPGPSSSSPYISPAFNNVHYSLIQYLQNLYKNPPAPLLLPLPLGPSPSRSLAVPMNGLSSGSMGLSSLGLAAAAAQHQQSSSSGMGFQQESGLGSAGAFRQSREFDFDSFAAGVGVESRYPSYREKFASPQQSPFMPSSPRVGEDENINFDHGALMTDLEETSFMAWF
ncbi:hypothetical protein BT96DRAFT_988202 [Gymnopus androsaceus JB14]|uniref:Zn(2)-C6 fungal-type domain-containing protein n=1 Tax=Gymnopus androsaceus JB14 TaxID=1447944 RepID=A0A6A4I6X2_9AGAR|nr:hypothetical protein BT96DRAFT_988202 [Gymnopus androsaceus JB14]